MTLLIAAATGLLGIAAAAAFGALGFRIIRRAADVRAMGSVFLLIATTLALHAVGTLTMVFSQGSDTLVSAALQQVAYVTAALSMVPLMGITARQLSKSRWLAFAASGFFLALALIGVSWLYTAGYTTTPHLGTPWAVPQETATSMLLAFIAMPALTAAGLLVFAAHKTRGNDGRRMRLASLATSLFFTAFTMDAIGAASITAPALRFVMTGAAVLGFAAFFPREVEQRLHIRVSERARHAE